MILDPYEEQARESAKDDHRLGGIESDFDAGWAAGVAWARQNPDVAPVPVTFRPAMSGRLHTVVSWNRQHPPGTPVRYFPVLGQLEHADTKTRSEAWELGSGEPVVLIEGRTGGIALSNLTPLVPESP